MNKQNCFALAFWLDRGHFNSLIVFYIIIPPVQQSVLCNILSPHPQRKSVGTFL